MSCTNYALCIFDKEVAVPNAMEFKKKKMHCMVQGYDGFVYVVKG